MKLKHLFTALLLLCCTIATAEEVTIDGIKYDVVTKAKQATVIAGGSYSGNIVIPSEITYNDVVYSVTSIGKSAFRDCSGLTSVTIGNSVTSIGDYAFESCSGLKSITIPNSVTSIGFGAFGFCNRLTSVYISDLAAWCKIDFAVSDVLIDVGGFDSNPLYYAKNLYLNNELVTGLVIPDGVTEIKSEFSGCSSFTSVTIPNSVTSIGNYAFRNCSGLTSITIPNSVTSIGDGTFEGCTSLTSITIPNSVTSIGDYAFESCSGLTSIEIPNSVTSIGGAAFEGCSGLTAVHISDLAAWCKIDFSYTNSNPLNYANNLYLNDKLVTGLVIPNGITVIKNNAFYGCSGLTSIEIPNSVTSIGEEAFSGCSGLTSITIGSGVKNIYEQAFANCENLADVYCFATTAPTTTKDFMNVIINQFENSYPEYMTLHVPAEAINDYKTTAPWSSFGTIVTLDGEEVETETPKCATPVISYENGQLLVTCDTDGAEFVTEITNSYVNKYYDSAIDLTATYNISTYATLAGYDNSDIVNATLFWVENGSSDNEIDVINIPATAVLVTSNNGAIYISGALDGENVAVYTTAGVLIGETTIANGNATVQSGLENGSAAVVKVGEKSVKVVVD